jgi:putative tryptophan/tyrosine transport system substrate-binding protein
MKQFWIFDHSAWLPSTGSGPESIEGWRGFGFWVGEPKSKKGFCLALGAMLLALCVTVEAQQPTKKVPVIGVFLADTASAYASYNEAFLQGLRDLGYVVGQNIILEYRYAGGKPDRYPELADKLVRLKVDMLVVVGGTLAAAKQATNTIPIVVATAGDLVGSGYIDSLARPGGNITGSTNLDSDLSGKRLKLLKEALPRSNRVAFLFWEGNKGDQDELKETHAAAQALKVRIQSLGIKDPSQFQGAFSAIVKERAEALIITNNNFNFAHRRQTFEFAAKNKLPSMCGRDAFVEAGCLVSYSGSRVDSFRRAAYFVDKILKGAKPTDLPVHQPTKFELIINLKTTKQIGVTIQPEILARATKVIR